MAKIDVAGCGNNRAVGGTIGTGDVEKKGR